MYTITATAQDGTDATQPEVLGEYHGRVFVDDTAALDAIEAIREALDGAEDAERFVGVTLATEGSDFADRVGTALDSISPPDGVRLSHEIVEDGDGMVEAVVVRLAIEDGATMTAAEWEALEEAIDLSGAGLTFRDGGGLGGPWLEGGTRYSGGMSRHLAHLRLSQALESVEDVFVPGTDLGLLARNPHSPDRHMFVSNLTWAEAVQALAETAASNGVRPSGVLRALADEMDKDGAK